MPPWFVPKTLFLTTQRDNYQIDKGSNLCGVSFDVTRSHDSISQNYGELVIPSLSKAFRYLNRDELSHYCL